MDCGSGGSQPRDGLCEKKAGAESFILSPGLNCNLESDSSIDMSDNDTSDQLTMNWTGVASNSATGESQPGIDLRSVARLPLDCLQECIYTPLHEDRNEPATAHLSSSVWTP